MSRLFLNLLGLMGRWVFLVIGLKINYYQIIQKLL